MPRNENHAFSEPRSTPVARLGTRSALIILCYGFSLYLVGLGSTRVLTYHETLFAQPAKEMIASGNWIIPKYVGIGSYHKPPLTHWTIAAAMWLGGTGETVVRLPAVLSALGTSLLIAFLAGRWFSDRIGLFAGLIQLTTFYTLMQGRLAEADMPLCLAVALGLVGFACAMEIGHARAQQRWLIRLVFASGAAAFLLKGPIGIIFVFGPITAYVVKSIINRDWRPFWSLLDPPGISLFLLGVTFWPISAYLADPGILTDWRMHHLGRFVGEMGGGKPFYFYFLMTPLLLLPWTPFAVVGLWKLARRLTTCPPSLTVQSQEGIMDRYWLLSMWFAVGFAVLSLAAWKHKHYLIPILPPLSIAAAVGLDWFAATSIRLFARWPVAAILLSLLGASPVVVAQTNPDLLGPTLVLCAILGAATVATIWLELNDRLAVRVPLLFATIWIAAAIVHLGFMPAFDSYKDQAEFAAQVNHAVTSNRTLRIIELPENQIAYYLTSPLERWDDAREWLDESNLEPGRSYFVLGPQSIAEKLSASGDVEVALRCPTIRKIMQEKDRITLFRLEVPPDRLASQRDRLER